MVELEELVMDNQVVMVGQEALHLYQQKHLLEEAVEVQDKPQWEPHQEVLVEAVDLLLQVQVVLEVQVIHLAQVPLKVQMVELVIHLQE